MAQFVKHDGAWKVTTAIWVKDAGEWKPVQGVYIRAGGQWLAAYTAERVATILADISAINAENYFAAEDWANPNIKKKLIVAEGVTVWSFTPSIPALTTGTGRGSTLTIVNNGSILGAGGNNSGTGGTAIQVAQNGTSLINFGDIFGGGGGGGLAGQGGPGLWYSGRSVSESGSWPNSYVSNYPFQDSNNTYVWNGAYIGVTTASSLASGIYTYYKGAFVTTTGNSQYIYGISRTYVAYDVPNHTAGGAGGAGGRGTGLDANQANVASSGSPGAAGGSNAGAGGLGGSGGGWGAQGGTGNAGAAGNNGAGAAGVTGGLAGLYIAGNDNLTEFVNNNAVLGRIA